MKFLLNILNILFYYFAGFAYNKRSIGTSTFEFNGTTDLQSKRLRISQSK